jgi:hypothetical protein
VHGHGACPWLTRIEGGNQGALAPAPTPSRWDTLSAAADYEPTVVAGNLLLPNRSTAGAQVILAKVTFGGACNRRGSLHPNP